MNQHRIPGFLRSLLTALAATATVAGCNPFPDDSTLGDEGRIEFSYASQCFLDCSLDHPIAVGSTELITIERNDAFQTFSSNNESVLEVSLKSTACSCSRSTSDGSDGYGLANEEDFCNDGYEKSCNVYIEAHAVSEGDAKLEVRDAAGELVDRVTVHSATPASATFRRYGTGDWTDASSLMGTKNGSELVAVVLRDSKGRELASSSGVAWTVDDPVIAKIEHQDPFFNWSRGSFARIHYGHAGLTSARVQTSGFETTIAVSVEQ